MNDFIYTLKVQSNGPPHIPRIIIFQTTIIIQDLKTKTLLIDSIYTWADYATIMMLFEINSYDFGVSSRRYIMIIKIEDSLG
jgi:hypothetical protein